MEQAVAVLHTQNQLLAHHPNANLYSHLAQFVELDGYYLESEPCLVCNNPEVALSSIKLSSIKVCQCVLIHIPNANRFGYITPLVTVLHALYVN